jgi:hypothetical protein
LKLFPAGWMYKFAPGMFAFLNVSAMLLYVYLNVCGRMLLLLHVRAWHARLPQRVRLPQRLRHAPVCVYIYMYVYVLMYAAGMLAFLNASCMCMLTYPDVCSPYADVCSPSSTRPPCSLCVRMLTYPDVCSPYADVCSPSSTRPPCSCACVSSSLV